MFIHIYKIQGKVLFIIHYILNRNLYQKLSQEAATDPLVCVSLLDLGCLSFSTSGSDTPAGGFTPSLSSRIYKASLDPVKERQYCEAALLVIDPRLTTKLLCLINCTVSSSSHCDLLNPWANTSIGRKTPQSKLLIYTHILPLGLVFFYLLPVAGMGSILFYLLIT